MSNDYPLTQQEFDGIYSKVPRLTVEIVLRNSERAIFLTKRSIEPCKGQWHLPGGTVYFGEAVLDTVKRIARRELNIQIGEADMVGYIEYPSHYKNGLDCPVGLVFLVENYTGELAINKEATEFSWFKSTPDNMHADQDVFLVKQGYLKS